MWRCFYKTTFDAGYLIIFSTYVEVFLSVLVTLAEAADFLHVCGGVSETP